MNKLPAVIVIAVFALCYACSMSDERGAFASVDEQGWLYGDSLHVNLAEPYDSVVDGRLTLVVRHRADYGYSNLWLEVSYPDADSLKPDTFNIRLADSFGNWYGKGLGLSYQLTDSTGRRLHLNAPATVVIRHIMRVDRLEGIEQIGLLIEPN